MNYFVDIERDTLPKDFYSTKYIVDCQVVGENAVPWNDECIKGEWFGLYLQRGLNNAAEEESGMWSRLDDLIEARLREQEMVNQALGNALCGPASQSAEGAAMPILCAVEVPSHDREVPTGRWCRRTAPRCRKILP